MAVYTLSGSGAQALTSGTGKLYISMVTLPSVLSAGRASPTNYYDIGLLRLGDHGSYYPAIPIDAHDMVVAVPAQVTALGYSLFGAASIQVTEVAGQYPFAPSLEGLSDVAVTSPANGQVLSYQSSSGTWINSTPSGGSAPAFFGARVYRSTNQSVGSSSYPVNISFSATRWDTDTMWSSGSPTRLTVHTAGKYLATAGVEFAGSSAGTSRQLQLRVNAATIIAMSSHGPIGTATINMNASAVWDFAINDYVEVIAYQDSGAAINVLTDAAFSPEFSMAKIG